MRNEQGIYQPDDDFLEHHGIKGMRWGHHKARASESDYSKKQENRDRAVYGKRAATRISKRIAKGAGVQEARSLEATRRASAQEQARVGKKVGTVAGAAGGLAVGAILTNKKTIGLGTHLAAKVVGRNAAISAGLLLSQPKTKALIIAGSTYAGSQIGRSVGASAPLKARGYSH